MFLFVFEFWVFFFFVSAMLSIAPFQLYLLGLVSCTRMSWKLESGKSYIHNENSYSQGLKYFRIQRYRKKIYSYERKAQDLSKDNSSLLNKMLHLPVGDVGQVSSPVLSRYTNMYIGKDK